MSVTLNSVKLINKVFKCQLIDEDFLVQFQQEFHYDFLYQIHYIRKIRNQNQKKEFITKIIQHLGRRQISLNILNQSKRVSDYANIVRELLCKKKTLKVFFHQRKVLLKMLKEQKVIDQEMMEGFRIFYDVFLQGNIQTSYRNNKSVLTGIRKLLKEEIKKTKNKRERRKQKDLLKHRKMLYRTNRIIRDILQHSQQLKKMYDNDSAFLESVNNILQERRWMGPNLYKVLVQFKWKGYQIDTLIDLMNEAYKKDPKYKQGKASGLIVRTIQNMRTCSDFLKKNPNMCSVRLIATVENLSLKLFSDGIGNNFFNIESQSHHDNEKENIQNLTVIRRNLSLSSEFLSDF